MAGRTSKAAKAERRLATYVHVHTTDGSKVFGPGDEVPAEYAELITNPKAWASDADEEPADEPDADE